jgi:hypothetical protein
MHDANEFMFDGMPVGCFEQMPRSPGRYRYEPYRGPGHYEVQTLRRSGGNPRCYYESGAERVSFTVRDCPEYGVLELYEFETFPGRA